MTASRFPSLEVLDEAVKQTLAEHPEYRRGQAYFNVLFFSGLDPDFANEIRGGPLDPFHVDDRIAPMREVLRERWASSE